MASQRGLSDRNHPLNNTRAIPMFAPRPPPPSYDNAVTIHSDKSTLTQYSELETESLQKMLKKKKDIIKKAQKQINKVETALVSKEYEKITEASIEEARFMYDSCILEIQARLSELKTQEYASIDGLDEVHEEKQRLRKEVNDIAKSATEKLLTGLSLKQMQQLRDQIVQFTQIRQFNFDYPQEDIGVSMVPEVTITPPSLASKVIDVLYNGAASVGDIIFEWQTWASKVYDKTIQNCFFDVIEQGSQESAEGSQLSALSTESVCQIVDPPDFILIGQKRGRSNSVKSNSPSSRSNSSRESSNNSAMSTDDPKERAANKIASFVFKRTRRTGQMANVPSARSNSSRESSKNSAMSIGDSRERAANKIAKAWKKGKETKKKHAARTIVKALRKRVETKKNQTPKGGSKQNARATKRKHNKK